MKVILAGYSKTGTKSMAAALSVLGYNTYDFFEHWWFHSDQWNKIFTQGGTIEDFKDMYKDVDAVVDMPAYFFWEEIYRAFPDSKIILTVRDEDSWYKSFEQQRKSDLYYDYLFTLLVATTRLNPLKILSSFQYLSNVLRVVFGAAAREKSNEMLNRIQFRKHNAYVLQTAPKDKLLVYKITDGWQPLCEFLGVDVPDQPFPHKNINCTARQDIVQQNPIALENIRITKERMWRVLGFLVILGAIYAYFTLQ